jgi:cysteine synthase B
MGTGRYLRERNPRVRIVALEPDEPLHGIEGLKHLETSIVPGVYDPSGHDERLLVSTEAAYDMCGKVLRSQGLLIGHSGGAALEGARTVAASLRAGVVVALLPDGGERYLS